jgi:hypothetical protein
MNTVNSNWSIISIQKEWEEQWDEMVEFFYDWMLETPSGEDFTITENVKSIETPAGRIQAPYLTMSFHRKPLIEFLWNAYKHMTEIRVVVPVVPPHKPGRQNLLEYTKIRHPNYLLYQVASKPHEITKILDELRQVKKDSE